MEQDQIRNFCIIAHIDHGKSTLADRLLEITHTIPPQKMKEQVLDDMDLEREKGITIKLTPVRMDYETNGSHYVLNLIDTPGHVDFSYEVSRSLVACEGAVLVVDATQGIQAQTLAHVALALENKLTIIPVINKIDLNNAQPEKVAEQLCSTFGFSKEDIIFVSAKNGTNVDKVIEAVIQKVPSPKGEKNKPLRALIFDSKYDTYKGVVVFVRVVDGEINLSNKNQRNKIYFLNSKATVEILEIGYFTPSMTKSDQLLCGEVGYIATGLKDVSLCRVGDTITLDASEVTPLPGYREMKPMVFLGLYPTEADNYLILKDALSKLKLSDASLYFEAESSIALGNGFRCGFLGLLHADIVQSRLEREFGLNLIASAPTVEYKADDNGKTIYIKSALTDWKEGIKIHEPWVALTIFTPDEFLGTVLQLCQERRGKISNMEYIDKKVKLSYEMPLSEIITDYYDQLKSITSGYASLDYEFLEYREVEAVKLDILINKEKVDALSQIVVRERANYIGRKLAERLKNVIQKQQYEISIQAAIGGKIVAREDVSAFRKDVIAKLYGGDRTRKDKLLDKQKKGKKRMKMVGRVELPQEAFFAVFKKGE